MSKRMQPPPDPAFVAEIDAIRAEHDRREKARPVGDGMAATSNGWMDFSGPRVPIKPDGSSSADVRQYRSVLKTAQDR